MKYYTIYKVTNLINGKFYIGKHITSDLEDDYMGSGNLIKRAIEKYGIVNFSKEYLEILDSKAKMNLAEKIYVINDLEVSYNLCPGGHGGFGYINKNNLSGGCISNNSRKNMIYGSLKFVSLLKTDEKFKIAFSQAVSNGVKQTYINGRKPSKAINSLAAINKKKETFVKTKHQQGSKNSQFGTCWITNGQENKKIKKEDLDNWLEIGYYKGRI